MAVVISSILSDIDGLALFALSGVKFKSLASPTKAIGCYLASLSYSIYSKIFPDTISTYIDSHLSLTILTVGLQRGASLSPFIKLEGFNFLDINLYFYSDLYFNFHF